MRNGRQEDKTRVRVCNTEDRVADGSIVRVRKGADWEKIRREYVFGKGMAAASVTVASQFPADDCLPKLMFSAISFSQ